MFNLIAITKEVYEAGADSKTRDEYNWNTIPHFKKLTHKSAYLISKHDASCMLRTPRTCLFKFDTFLCVLVFVFFFQFFKQRRETTTFKSFGASQLICQFELKFSLAFQFLLLFRAQLFKARVSLSWTRGNFNCYLVTVNGGLFTRLRFNENKFVL